MLNLHRYKYTLKKLRPQLKKGFCSKSFEIFTQVLSYNAPQTCRKRNKFFAGKRFASNRDRKPAPFQNLLARLARQRKRRHEIVDEHLSAHGKRRTHYA